MKQSYSLTLARAPLGSVPRPSSRLGSRLPNDNAMAATRRLTARALVSSLLISSKAYPLSSRLVSARVLVPPRDEQMMTRRLTNDGVLTNDSTMGHFFKIVLRFCHDDGQKCLENCLTTFVMTTATFRMSRFTGTGSFYELTPS